MSKKVIYGIVVATVLVIVIALLNNGKSHNTSYPGDARINEFEGFKNSDGELVD